MFGQPTILLLYSINIFQGYTQAEVYWCFVNLLFYYCIPLIYSRNIHKQKFTGVWSTYYSTIVFHKEKDIIKLDSFYNEQIRLNHYVFYVGLYFMILFVLGLLITTTPQNLTSVTLKLTLQPMKGIS